MTKTEMRKQSGISTGALAKLGKNENVSMEVLVKICRALDCDLSKLTHSQRISNTHCALGTCVNALRFKKPILGAKFFRRLTMLQSDRFPILNQMDFRPRSYNPI